MAGDGRPRVTLIAKADKEKPVTREVSPEAPVPVPITVRKPAPAAPVPSSVSAKARTVAAVKRSAATANLDAIGAVKRKGASNALKVGLPRPKPAVPTTVKSTDADVWTSNFRNQLYNGTKFIAR